MKPTTSEPIEYHGWEISEETDPWAQMLMPKMKYKYSNDGRVFSAESIEQAKAEIDERVND